MDKQEQNTSTAPDSAPESPASESKLNSAKQKLGALAEKAKQHDFKGDAKAAAESAKALKESLKKHDFKAELKEAFAEARKSPASIWKKPETPRPGKELAVTGLAVAIILFLLSIPFSGAVLGLVFLILSVAALLLCLLGLKTEGRKLAIGGTAVGLLVIFCSLGQIFGSSNRGEEDAEDATSKVAVTNEQESKVVKEYPLLSEAVTNEQESTNVDEYPLLIENEGEEASNVEEILEMAENAKKMESLNFYGFYTGMSFKNAKKLRSHYELNEKQLWFKWNKKNGEVYGMYFTPKALTTIMDVANNFETVELTMQDYLGIVAWNNEKEVTKGEMNSLFQDDTDKLLWGDAANVARWYKTADGVVAKLYPKGWDATGKAVFSIIDNQRMERDPAIKAQRAREAEEAKQREAKRREEFEEGQRRAAARNYERSRRSAAYHRQQREMIEEQKAANAKREKERRDKEEIAKAKEAAEKSKSYMDEVSSYKEGVFDYGSSLGKKDQRRWLELADQAQKSADDAQAKIKDAEEHPESGWDVNILTTQYNNAIQERDSHLRRVEDVKANRVKYFLGYSTEKAKEEASRMEKVAKNAMSEADRLAKTGPEKAVQFWKEVAANATAAAQGYQKLIPEFTKAAAELTEKSNAGQESK